MNKHELIDAVAAGTGESKAGTDETIDAILEAVTAAVTRGDTRWRQTCVQRGQIRYIVTCGRVPTGESVAVPAQAPT
ncbi:HU family DNA-binding protein [Paraburkholderia hospita]|uniref:HU family DNA-binding protein n=1 Tax=Paraburkholderia hospita TaxID=169430 RepID=UPI000B6967E0|nr:HU family DNA-binding protein [Paraburkholderia hospita]OUL73040.1 hypothetical protein CA601_44385 [Paraburkholderia hospita]